MYDIDVSYNDETIDFIDEFLPQSKKIYFICEQSFFSLPDGDITNVIEGRWYRSVRHPDNYNQSVTESSAAV